MPRMMREQTRPELHRILARGRGQFVHEALDKKRLMRMPHRPPEADRNRQFDRGLRNPQIGPFIRLVKRALFTVVRSHSGSGMP